MRKVFGVDVTTVEQMIRDEKGNITNVAKHLRVSRQKLYRYIEEHVSLKAVVEEARESMKDYAESKLFEALGNGAPWAICFFLKTQAKDRGYIERNELTGKDGEGLSVTTKVVRGPRA